MTAQQPVFTSQEAFNQYTFNLSNQLKSIKLNALRSAMAQAAGFTHLDAYLKHLDQTDTVVTSEVSGCCPSCSSSKSGVTISPSLRSFFV
jgi:Fe-S cluster biogenesis protein NfuA